MSTPMFDMPEHCEMPINADGVGPADPEETVSIVCWCGEDGCEEYKR